MSSALVLEGGAMRGMYTAAVLDVFMQNNISFDSVTAVSAGALFGVNFLSGQQGRVIRYNKRFNSDKNYMGLLPLIKEGNIVSTKYAYHDVPYELDPFDDEKFKASGVPFYAAVTNMRSGKTEYMRVTSVFEQMDILRASGSLPFVSKLVTIDGEEYLDGGITDSIPFNHPLSMNCDKLVVIVTRDMTYRKKAMSPSLAKLFYRKYPEFQKCLLNRHNMYNNSIEELQRLEKEGKAFVIRPTEPIDIKRIEKDSDRLQQVYNLGLSDADYYMPRLKVYMEIQ